MVSSFSLIAPVSGKGNAGLSPSVATGFLASFNSFGAECPICCLTICCRREVLAIAKILRDGVRWLKGINYFSELLRFC